jgi:hypothetical protein
MAAAALVVLCSSFANPQSSWPQQPSVFGPQTTGTVFPPSRGSRRAAFDDKIGPEPGSPARIRYSPAELMNQAVELSKLGQSLASEIQQVGASDFARNLKRIEKLSRKLRDEIAP